MEALNMSEELNLVAAAEHAASIITLLIKNNSTVECLTEDLKFSVVSAESEGPYLRIVGSQSGGYDFNDTHIELFGLPTDLKARFHARRPVPGTKQERFYSNEPDDIPF